MNGRVLCALLLGVPMAAGAQSVATPAGLRLEDAVSIALRANADLRIARATVDSAHAMTRIARAYPNPLYQLTPGTPAQYGLTIPVDVGPQRTYRTRVAALGMSAASADARDAERQVTLAVQRAYYDILLADEHHRIATTRRALVSQLVSADSARLRAGDIAARALARSQVELARADADVARTALAAVTTRLALETLIGIAVPDTALRLDGSLEFHPVTIPGDTLITNRLASRPDVQAATTRAEQSEASRQLARSALLPVPSLSYVRQTAAPFESGRYWALGFGVELPILNLYGGERERARAGADAAIASQQRTLAAAARDARSALADLRVQSALVTRYRTGVLQQVSASVEAARYAYVHGASSLLEVLDAVRAQQDVLTDYADALHDYWIAVRAVEAQLMVNESPM